MSWHTKILNQQEEPFPNISARPLNLTWDAANPNASWTFPCGCLLHPTGDNNTHGGGPHVHQTACHEGHLGEQEVYVQRTVEAIDTDMKRNPSREHDT